MMWYHWGLGVGHTYSHCRTQDTSASNAQTDVEMENLQEKLATSVEGSHLPSGDHCADGFDHGDDDDDGFDDDDDSFDDDDDNNDDDNNDFDDNDFDDDDYEYEDDEDEKTDSDDLDSDDERYEMYHNE